MPGFWGRGSIVDLADELRLTEGGAGLQAFSPLAGCRGLEGGAALHFRPFGHRQVAEDLEGGAGLQACVKGVEKSASAAVHPR
jgi:hypothetical protein